MLQLQVRSLTRAYGPRRVLNGIDLTVEAGSVLVVTGPNGAGKSTLLRCLAGLERPSSGTVRWMEGDREWNRQERRRRLGFISPELALYDELTGLENLRFFARVRGVAGGDRELGELLARVGLEARANDLAADYSSGMRQRLKWAFALLGEPDGLLLDEPGVTLDESGFTLSGDLIGRARQQGRVVIVATNDSREIGYGDDRLELG
jgi:heme exporter protein A